MSSQRTRAPRRKIIGANWEAQQPRRGRPPAKTPRKATRVYLNPAQREHWLNLNDILAPLGAARIDVAHLLVCYLEQELNNIQSGLTGENQGLPVGVVDLTSLYFLLDLKSPDRKTNQFNITMLTETREKIAVITIRLQSVFRATWSQVFGLATELMFYRLQHHQAMLEQLSDLEDLREFLFHPQQLQFDTWERRNAF